MKEDSSEQPPAKRVKYDFSQTFDVLVGSEKKRFTVYHDLLTERSGFFKAARSSRWSGGTQDPTDLSDHDPEDFSNYLQLVYTGTVIPPDVEVVQWCDAHRPENTFDAICGQVNSHNEALIDLYILADKLEDLKSSNMVMDSIIHFGDRTGKMLLLESISRVYTQTPGNSRLRTMIRDMIIYEAQGDYFEGSTKADHPKQLLLDIAEEYLNIKWSHKKGDELNSDIFSNTVSKLPRCRYHQHNDKHPECEKESGVE